MSDDRVRPTRDDLVNTLVGALMVSPTWNAEVLPDWFHLHLSRLPYDVLAALVRLVDGFAAGVDDSQT